MPSGAHQVIQLCEASSDKAIGSDDTCGDLEEFPAWESK